jgi:hypothetical protein
LKAIELGREAREIKLAEKLSAAAATSPLSNNRADYGDLWAMKRC